MKTKMSTKKVLILVLLVLIFACLFFISSLRFSSQRSAEQYPWTTDITVYNNTDVDFCRIWFQPNDTHLPLRAYIFSKDQLENFEKLESNSSLKIEDVYLTYGLYNLWTQKCGTTLWNKSASIVVSGKVCGPETVIQLGEPIGLSATQTVLAYPIEPAPTPLVTPQFTKQTDGFSGIYFHSSEDAKWESSNTGTHYIHTLLRFYNDGLVIGTYLEFNELKGLGYVASELSDELHHFNRYNALGKPHEYGEDQNSKPFFVPGTLYQRRLAYGHYYIEDDQIWFTLTTQECHHSTLTELEWNGSREYVGKIIGNTLELKTYSLRSDTNSELEIVISKGPYGHDYVSHINGGFVIERYIGYKHWDNFSVGAEQTFQRVDIDLGDE